MTARLVPKAIYSRQRKSNNRTYSEISVRPAFMEIDLASEQRRAILRSTTDRKLGTRQDETASGRAHPRLVDRPNPLDNILAEVETAHPVFQTWVLAKRQTVRDQVIRQLENGFRAQARITSEAREPTAAITIWTRRMRRPAVFSSGRLSPTAKQAERCGSTGICGTCLNRITTSSQLSKRRILSR